jgi:hypothetical protein
MLSDPGLWTVALLRSGFHRLLPLTGAEVAAGGVGALCVMFGGDEVLLTKRAWVVVSFFMPVWATDPYVSLSPHALRSPRRRVMTV